MPCQATRRIQGAAVWVVAALMTCGCKWMPVRPVERPRPLAEGASNEVEKPSELPPLPVLRSIPDEEAFQPAPTPLLDAAAERDEAVKRALAMKVVSDSDSSSNPSLIRLATPPVAQEDPADPPDSKSDPAVEPATFVAPKPEQPPRADRPPPDPVDPESSLWHYVMSALAEAVIAEPETIPAPAFAISDLRICKRVLGFGRTEPIAAEALVGGSRLLLYCEIEGVRDEECPQGFRSRIASSLAIFPASGGEAAWRFDLGNAEDVCQRRRRDFFVNYRITIPQTLPPGDYQIRLVQRDLLAGSEASHDIPLTVRAK